MTIAQFWPKLKDWMPAIVLALVFVMLLVYRIWRRRMLALARTESPVIRFENLECQKCGYPLKGLEIPRCPECGALAGFATSAAELGISETELRRGFAKTKRRRERRAAVADAPDSLDVRNGDGGEAAS